MSQYTYNKYLKRKYNHLDFNPIVKKVKNIHKVKINRKRKIGDFYNENIKTTQKKQFVSDCLIHTDKYICNIYECKGIFKLNETNVNICTYII